jgi:short-subunit dehydrogenase
MSEFKQKYGPWALVTGASSGIGMEFARQLAAQGLNLVLVARREDKLNALSSELKSRHGIDAKVVTADLSREDFLPALRSATAGLEIGLLVNNAGLTTTGAVVDNKLEDELELLHLNCRAPLMLAHEYGKAMRDRKRGGMVFLGSVLSFAAVPVWANYAASKAYDLMLAEGLAAEMKEHNVDVLALCPGFTRTEFAEFAKLNDLMAMDAGPVVKTALNKLGKARVAVPGIMNKLNIFTTRLQPRFLNTLIFGMVVKPSQQVNLHR